MAAQPLAVQVGVAPACQALGLSRATFYRRQRSTPGHQQPRPTPARALCEAEREAGPRCARRPTLRRPCAGGGRGDAASTTATTCARSDDVSDTGPRIGRSESGAINVSIPVHQTRAGGHSAEPDLVLGHHQAVGAGEVDYFYSTSCSTSSAATRSAGWSPTGRTRRRPVISSKRPATNRASSPGAHSALRSRRADDEQVHRTTARRPRGQALAEPPPGVR